VGISAALVIDMILILKIILAWCDVKDSKEGKSCRR
jgi:hypothetical protein